MIGQSSRIAHALMIRSEFEAVAEDNKIKSVSLSKKVSLDRTIGTLEKLPVFQDRSKLIELAKMFHETVKEFK